MQAVAPVISAYLTVENMIMTLNALRAALSFIKVSQLGDFEYSTKLAKETSEGAFHTVYTLEDEVISAEKVNQDLANESVTCVKRCCCSLTGWFPSGVLTVASWLVAGTTIRHEYIILHTTNYVIVIEIGLDNKETSKTSIRIKKACTKEEKKQAENELLKIRRWTRTMKKLIGIELGRLKFHQIASLVSFWIIFNRAGGKDYTAIQKNCKSLARSILYFSKKSTNYWDVLYSIWGIFTDKPFNIFYHMEMVLIEKAVVNSVYITSKDLKELVEKAIDYLEGIRNCQLDQKDIESN